MEILRRSGVVPAHAAIWYRKCDAIARLIGRSK
jgi:hypothetical protein